jgi:hypothetical protein
MCHVRNVGKRSFYEMKSARDSSVDVLDVFSDLDLRERQ